MYAIRSYYDFFIFEDYGKKHIPESGPIIEKVKEPKKLYGFIIDSMNVVEDNIKPNENLSEILSYNFV